MDGLISANISAPFDDVLDVIKVLGELTYALEERLVRRLASELDLRHE